MQIEMLGEVRVIWVGEKLKVVAERVYRNTMLL
jgi:hypothetical protein